MNRRQFIKSMLASAAALATADLDAIVEKTITETAHLSDGDFVTYITMNMQMLVSNPASCAIITNIMDLTEPTIKTNKSHNRLTKSRMRRNNKNKTASHSRKRNWT